MLTSLDPKQAILPIFKMSRSISFRGLLGTGFVVGIDPPFFLVTAAHVLRDTALLDDEILAIALYRSEQNIEAGEIGNYKCSDKYDVAVVGLAGLADIVSLPILSGNISTQDDVLTFEYSSTSTKPIPDGRVGAHFSPFTHKGNVLRHHTSDYPEKVPTHVLDTSFPALQGASGAPVMRATDLAVAGMLVANHERQLLPAQVVRIEHDDKSVEETKYFLPTGRAVSSEVLRAVLDDFQVKYELAR